MQKRAAPRQNTGIRERATPAERTATAKRTARPNCTGKIE